MKKLFSKITGFFKNIFKRIKFEIFKRRVEKVLFKHKDIQKRMVFDDEGHLYGSFVENPGFNNTLNLAYYVVLKKKVYAMILTHEMSRAYNICRYSDSILYAAEDPEFKPKVYKGLSADEEFLSIFGKLAHLYGSVKE